MDITLGRVLPPGFADPAATMASRLPDLTLPRTDATRQPGAIPLDGPGSVLNPQAPSLAGVGAASGVMDSFAQLLSQAMQDVNQLHHAADADANKLAAGEPVDIHQVMIGMEKANIAFGLTLQVRNKLIEAYQEVMRIQV
jgi:flagellar hook-basal body complex protein FliE